MVRFGGQECPPHTCPGQTLSMRSYVSRGDVVGAEVDAVGLDG